MKNLFGYTLTELEEEMVNRGESRFRAKQLFDWIYAKKVYDFSLMSNISKNFREILPTEYSLSLPTIYTKQESQDGTIKLLLEMEDGSKVECVLMRYNYGNAICVSSQVGCYMGCAFCASGLLKKTRDLTTAEMVGEVIVMNQLLAEEGERVTNIDVMGTGEPFDNYDNVMRFIRIMNSPFALAIGARHITVSTCGLPKGIERYSHEGLQTNLAISLHAPNDKIRNEIMPVSRSFPMEELLSSIKKYIEVSGRRVSFEYIMIKDLNDSLVDADELAMRLRGISCFVNLIPLNPVKEKPYERASSQRVKAFWRRLNEKGINCTIRKEFGSDIDAACGQLRVKMMKGEEKDK